MKKKQNCPVLSDQNWALLSPHLPGQRGQWGGVAQDNRRFINAVLWILHTSSPWRELPPEYGKWGTVYQRFHRWRLKGIWEKLLELLLPQPGFEWLLGSTPFSEAATGLHSTCRQRVPVSPNRRHSLKYPWPWLRLVCRSELLLQQVPLHFSSRRSQRL